MAKRNVTKEERETIVNFNEAEDTAVIYTFNNDLKKRLAAFANKYPDLCKLKEESKELGSVSYIVQKSRVSIHINSPQSEARRKAASDYAKKHGNLSAIIRQEELAKTQDV